MPRFPGTGPRIAERMLALGYRQPNGKPDVSKFAREKGYDKTIFYEWVKDASTPTKEVDRLAGDLGVNVPWLLFGFGKPESAAARAPAKAAGGRAASGR